MIGCRGSICILKVSSLAGIMYILALKCRSQLYCSCRSCCTWCSRHCTRSQCTARRLGCQTQDHTLCTREWTGQVFLPCSVRSQRTSLRGCMLFQGTENTNFPLQDNIHQDMSRRFDRCCTVSIHQCNAGNTLQHDMFLLRTVSCTIRFHLHTAYSMWFERNILKRFYLTLNHVYALKLY